MRMAVITRPLLGVAEAANCTGDPTVEPSAGDETETPAPPVVVTPETVMFIGVLKTCPLEFHAWTTTK